MSNSLLFIIALFFFVACSSPKETKVINLKYSIEEQIKIDLDSVSTPINYCVQLLETDSCRFVATMGRTPFGINIYNLETKKKAHQIKLSSDGIDKVGVSNGFFIQSADTVLITSVPAIVSIFDINGKKARDIKIEGSDQYVQTISSSNYRPLIIENQKIYGAYPFITKHWETSLKDVSKYQHLFEYDLVKSTIKWLNYSLPVGFWDSGIFSPEFSLISKGDSIVTVFSRDLRINVFSKSQNKIISTLDLDTPEKMEFAKYQERPYGDEGVIKGLENGVIKGMVFDKYRNVYYVIFELPTNPELYQLSLLQLYSNRPDFKVFVLDSNFEYRGEVLFKNYSADQRELFVGRKGLYVSRNNQNNIDFDENYLIYDVIRFEGLDYED
ncbi:DUF4221 domain-containing protein [Belliella sp. DSM 107340]|uniref:DUF4221 domain-containing protein n=1 Tax=Belliella calami TaxID=2923436 RepID=A0ABS9UQR5_9BACT|nr:DUF4221 family protein [Belliella calami]MCH7398588.1 DUF4221 domain-containing protein [Belliella calami]